MIYVDDRQDSHRGMLLCRLGADTKKELLDFVAKLGISSRHMYSNPYPHFDICKTKRRLAIELGAKEVTQAQFFEVMNKVYPQPASVVALEEISQKLRKSTGYLRRARP